MPPAIGLELYVATEFSGPNIAYSREPINPEAPTIKKRGRSLVCIVIEYGKLGLRQSVAGAQVKLGRLLAKVASPNPAGAPAERAEQTGASAVT